jgi:hypothetical protein
MSQRIPQLIAMGKVNAKGHILRATPGIEVTFGPSPSDLLGGNQQGTYLVSLPNRLVCDGNYIIQLTAEDFGEDGPDYTITSIAYLNQSARGFEVIIWGDRRQTTANGGFSSVAVDWHFVIYDML